MKYAVLTVLALALLASLPGGALTSQPREVPVGPVVPADKPISRPPAHEVWEVRFLLLTPNTHPTRGIDLEIDHLLGAGSPEGGGRFLTVGADTPETLVTNLTKLGDVRVLDRANISVIGEQRAKYVRGIRIPVPQVEVRSQNGQPNSFVRTKFEEVGTKLMLSPKGKAMQASIETSFLLDVTEPYGYPLIATANWETSLTLPVGKTAVFRSHFAVPGPLLRFDATGAARGIAVSGAEKKVDVPPRDLGRVLVVLLTRSMLP